MLPEEKARLAMDQELTQFGWMIRDMKHLKQFSAMGTAVREFPTSTGEVGYALFIDGPPWALLRQSGREQRKNHHGGGSVRTLRRKQIQVDREQQSHPPYGRVALQVNLKKRVTWSPLKVVRRTDAGGAICVIQN